MPLPSTLAEKDPGLKDWSILTCYRGSVAHGMYLSPETPAGTDDKDVMAVCVPPQDYYLGLIEYGRRGTQEIKQDEWDVVIYELRKFVRLLLKGNPNVLTALWLEPMYYLHLSGLGRRLVESRGIFASKQVYHTFVGYACDQLHAMTHQKFQGYMGAKRKALVEKYGYDCRNASHLIRLLRMGVEFLSSGRLQVERPDAAQLLEIKRGEWTLEQVKAEADRLFRTIEQSYLLSKLPEVPDHQAANRLLVDLIQQQWALY